MTNLFSFHPKAQFLCAEKNVGIDIATITTKSGKKLWFTCNVCNHDFEKMLKNVTVHNQWCPYCSIGCKRFCEDLDCQHCLKKSFGCNERLKNWSPKNKVDPRRLFNNTTTRYIFDCDKCGHEFLQSPENISKGCWCYYCGNQALCDNDDCSMCFQKSFASHILSKFWSDKNELKPRQIFKSTGKKYYLKCETCHHDVFVSLNWLTNTKENRQTFCGYCGKSSLCDDENCEHCFKRSFASLPVSTNWSDKNDKTPRQVFRMSNKKYIFDCDKCGNEFKMVVSSVATGHGCGKCKHKTELKLYNFLLGKFNNIVSQFSPEWIGVRRFDFCLEDIKIIIELDGRQHFIQVKNWDPPETTQSIDKEKMRLANTNGYSVIRILQEDVFLNKYDWKEELINAIDQLQHTTEVQNTFLCKNNEYLVFQCEDNPELNPNVKIFKTERRVYISRLKREYMNIRIENLSFINFTEPNNNNRNIDFYVGKLKCKEKITDVSKYKSCEGYRYEISLCYYEETKKVRKHKMYKKGENDLYWFHVRDTTTFYVVPEIVLYNHKYIFDTEVVKIKILNIGKNQEWLSSYKFDYQNIDRPRLLQLLQLPTEQPI